MRDSLKEERDKGLNEFIIDLLKKRPLAASSILDCVIDSKKFKINTAPGLRMYHLNYLEKNRFIFRLDRKQKNFLRINSESKFKRIVPTDNKNNEYLSAQEFMEKHWFKWETSSKHNKGNNYFHAYYFATPMTAKWNKIINKIIKENILNKFGEFINYKEEIVVLINEILECMTKIEIHPKNKYSSIKNKTKNKTVKKNTNTSRWLAKLNSDLSDSDLKKLIELSREFKPIERKMLLPFGFADYITHDFKEHISLIDNFPLVIGFGLMGKLDTLHWLLNQQLNIVSIIDYEFKKEDFVESNEYLNYVTKHSTSS